MKKRKFNIAMNALIIILSIGWIVVTMLNEGNIVKYAMGFCMFMSGFCGLISYIFRSKLPHPAKILDIISGLFFLAFAILMFFMKAN